MRVRFERDEVYHQYERHNSTWLDHVARENVTAGLIAWLKPSSVLDPACGDGGIVLMADRIHPIKRMVLNDISIPNRLYLEKVIAGREGTLPMVTSIDAMVVLTREETFDIVVLTEFLEHVKDPDAILRAARQRATFLVASSPEMRPGQHDPNMEHFWMFDGEGYLEMLLGAGWNPFHKTHMGFPGFDYDFQVWVCK